MECKPLNFKGMLLKVPFLLLSSSEFILNVQTEISDQR